MSGENGTSLPQGPSKAEAPIEESKGKGKAPATEEPADQSMDDDSDDDEDGDEAADAEDDNMDEIDPNNIVSGGRRTRGKVIDWAKAAEEVPAEEDEDEEDDDFQGGGEGEGADDDDKMDED